MGKLGAAICTVLLVGAAGAIVAWEEWRGPVVLSLSAGHGIHADDLAALPLIVLAIAVWRRQVPEARREARSASLAGPISATLLGVMLLVAGVVSTAGGGPLVPSGGGTLDGTIQQTSATEALPTGRWSDVAVTYDGTTLRLYVDGTEVSSRETNGAIQTTSNPLWIGGNQPYGEHFRGLIDEVRVYARALRPDEIRNDMEEPVAPATDLLAGYAFDEGAGTKAVDSSGHGNAGAISGATWTHGRFGEALSFDGVSAVVRVPQSSSLNPTKEMTLSGWVRPRALQNGWRTIVQRQTDAYMLTAGSDFQARLGRLDDVRGSLIAAALAWLCVAIATGRSPSTAGRRRSWWLPAGLFLLGALADAALAPDASLIGSALVALWLAATAAGRAEAVAFGTAGVTFTALTIASLPGIVGADVALSADDGAVARSMALGALFLIAGAWILVHRASSAAVGARTRRASVRRSAIR